MNGLTVRILGDDSDLQSTLSSAAKSLAKWGAIAASAAGAAGAAIVKSGLESADAMAKQAQQLGISSKELATLKRAADMAGVSQEQLGSASRALTTRLAQAASGTGSAGQALDALGLSIDDVIKLPLDQRIGVINDALKNNVAASEQAAVAAQLFGEDAALAVSKIDASVLATAANDINVFNAALSDVDAAKIENANDAMSRLGLAFDSVKLQSAAEFSGILNALADNVFEAAKETDFFKNGIKTAMDLGIAGAGYLADAFRGAQLAVQGVVIAYDYLSLGTAMALEGVVQMWDDTTRAILEKYNSMISAINKIPGVNIELATIGESQALASIQAWRKNAETEVEASKQRFNELLNEEMPSDALDRWVEAAREASQKAAEATVEGRNTGANNAIPTGDTGRGDPLKAEKDAAQARLDVIRQSFMTEQELADEKYQSDLEALYEANALGLEIEGGYWLQRAELEERYTEESLQRQKDQANKELQIARASQQAKLGYVSQTFNALSSLMDTENRKLFEIGKAAAISGAIVDGYAGVQKTLASVPAPFNYALAAAQGVAAAANVAKIASTSFGSGGSVSPSAGGAATSAATTQQQQTAQAAPQQQVSIALSGDVYSRQSVTQLIEQINDAVSDGARIRIA